MMSVALPAENGTIILIGSLPGHSCALAARGARSRMKARARAKYRVMNVFSLGIAGRSERRPRASGRGLVFEGFHHTGRHRSVKDLGFRPNAGASHYRDTSP